MLKLKANKRTAKTKAEFLREEGLIPAIVYGPKQEPISIAVKAVEFIKIYEEAGESSIVSLDIDGDECDTLVHEIQMDPMKNIPTHVDFYAVEKGKKIQVPVRLEFVGVSPAEKTLGGMLLKVMHEVEIEAMAKDLPSELEVSLESLVDFETQILAKDIVIPSGVTLLTEGDEVIALVKEAKEEEAEEVTAPDLSSIEVEKKGKKEEETPAE